MPRLHLFRLPFVFLALALLATVPLSPVSPARAAGNPLKRPPRSHTPRHLSLLPLRADTDAHGRIFEEPQWLDRDNVLAHVNMPDGFFIVPYKINLRTGQFHALKLNPPVWDCKPAHWSLSPDKKWVLWRLGRFDKSSTTYATRLDGRGSRSWNNYGSRTESEWSDSGADVLWLPRSHRWVGFRVRQTDSSFIHKAALIHDLDRPKARPRIVPLPAAVRLAEVGGVLPDGRILMVKYPDDSPQPAAAAKVKLFLVDLHAPKRPQKTQIALPEGVRRVNEIRLSPNGRSLAWEFCACDGKGEKATFYVSELSGCKMRTVRPPRIQPDEGLYLQGWYSDSYNLLFEVRQDKEIPKTDYLCWVAVP